MAELCDAAHCMAQPPSEIFSGYPRRVRERFERFNDSNPHVFQHFIELAQRMRGTGREHYSARTLVEVMRWDEDLRTTSSSFKINGDFVPLMARWLVHLEPAFQGFFELRQVRSTGRGSKEQRQRTRRKREPRPVDAPQMKLL